MKNVKWKDTVFFVCAGLGDGQTRGFVNRWAWDVDRALDRRWRWMSDRFSWNRAGFLDRGVAEYEEWVSVRLAFEYEVREYSRWSD